MVFFIGRYGRLVFGETEIEQLRPSVGEHDVAGLEIAMDDPLAVRRAERARNRDGDLECLVKRERAFLDAGGESLALEVLHGDEGPATVFSKVINRADVRMI